MYLKLKTKIVLFGHKSIEHRSPRPVGEYKMIRGKMGNQVMDKESTTLLSYFLNFIINFN
jgi:hypothetical protein